MKLFYVKYPRTFHLPYSLSKTNDDKTLETDEHFKKMKDVVVTIKMDGENTTVYANGYMHARSIDSNNKPWQKEVKALISNWYYKLPDTMRVCGENLQAKHSISYSFNNRKDLFQVFGIYDTEDERDMCLSWDLTKYICKDFGISTVPVIYRGKYDKDKILQAFNEYCKQKAPEEVEGFVVRNACSFPTSEFSENVGKYVRANHVQTDEHWTKNWENNKIIKN